MGTVKFLILVMMVNLVTALFHAEVAKPLVLRKDSTAAKATRPSLLDWEALEACISQSDRLF